MCGIAGIARQGAAVPEATLWRMADSLRHRGPDDSGVYADGGLGLAHTRLAILDLSPNGRQPMASADGRFVLAYNGEAYNYRDLRRELAASGHRFRGESDTEVVLAALTRWGHAALARLEGMFALALWDGRRRRLLLARDRFGVKPLYYCVNDGALAFGSEIKALLASGEVEPSVDWAGLCEVVHYNAALGERTTFAGVRKLLPGQKLTWEGGGAALATFACVHDVAPARDDFASAVAKTRRLLSRAVESHLASDVDVGVFLSGGMDSSAIVALASRHRPLRTYAAGFDVDADERPMARQVAERFGTEHHEVSVAGANVPSVIERLVAVFDAPSGDAANIPLFLLAEQLEGDVKVILQGDGGDEMFGGYPRYALLARERWLRACGLMAPLALALAPAGGRWRRRLATLRHMRHPDPAMRLALLMAETGADAAPLPCSRAKRARRWRRRIHSTAIGSTTGVCAAWTPSSAPFTRTQASCCRTCTSRRWIGPPWRTASKCACPSWTPSSPPTRWRCRHASRCAALRRSACCGGRCGESFRTPSSTGPRPASASRCAAGCARPLPTTCGKCCLTRACAGPAFSTPRRWSVASASMWRASATTTSCSTSSSKSRCGCAGIALGFDGERLAGE